VTILVHRPVPRLLPRPLPLFAEAWERRRRRRRLGLAVALGLAGLGGGLGWTVAEHAAGRTAHALPEPCALLTNAEAGGVLGTPIDFRQRVGNGRYGMCTWTSRRLSRLEFPEVRRSLNVQVTRSTKAAARQSAGLPGSVRVSGLGEIAFAQGGGGAVMLDAYAHGYAIEVMASYVTAPLAVEKQAARTILGEL
jgi:hypothetical protein